MTVPAAMSADLAAASLAGVSMVIRAAEDLEIPGPIRGLVTLAATLTRPAPITVAGLVEAVLERARATYTDDALDMLLEVHVDPLVERVVIGVALGAERRRDRTVREPDNVGRWSPCAIRADLRERVDVALTASTAIVQYPMYGPKGIAGGARLGIAVLALIVRHPETVDERIVRELRGWTDRAVEAGRLAAIDRLAALSRPASDPDTVN